MDCDQNDYGDEIRDEVDAINKEISTPLKDKGKKIKRGFTVD